MDLSVLTKRKFSKKELKFVHELFLKNGLVQDEYGYASESEAISLAVYISREPEKDDYWEEGLIEAMGFEPKTEFKIESRHNEESLVEAYLLGKKLAERVNGIIYDPQVGVFYNPKGEPFAHYRNDDKLEEYGAGMDIFMSGLSILRDMLGDNEET